MAKGNFIGNAKKIEGSNDFYFQLDLTKLDRLRGDNELEIRNIEFKDGVHELLSGRISEMPQQYQDKHKTHSLKVG